VAPVRTVVSRETGSHRLAMRTGTLHRTPQGSMTGLVLKANGADTPVVILAPHALDREDALVADAHGTPVIWEGDQVELVGGLAPPDDPRYPATFLAWRVSVITE
jgi:hypothetical protein